MKIRNGFVSNSSSTSFIIVIENSNVCECCGRSDPDILDCIEKMNDYNTELITTGKESIKNYIIDNYYSDDKLIKKIEEVDDTDKKMAMISVPYRNDFLTDLIKNSKNIKIIYEENE